MTAQSMYPPGSAGTPSDGYKTRADDRRTPDLPRPRPAADNEEKRRA